uniref:KlcB n=1 Tax=Yersinia pestis 16/95 TaxID=1365102 RepID=A0A193PYN8_YERPE|nr:FIG00466505: hypothetical protein [Yersinia pestis 16/95]
MAKRTKQPARAGQDWSAPAAELLAELPADRDGLLAAAVAAVVEIDAAVMRGDGAAAELAGERYEAIIWKLNGGTNFGCMAHDEAAGRVIERHCAAVPGDVPLWGQRGQFLVVAGGVRALVEYEAGYGGPLNAHFQFHAVDLDRPFISATGYRSHFDTARGCMTVDEVARGILAAMLAEKKRPVLIEASYRDRLADDPLPGWLAGLVPPARRVPATVTIPPGFVLVDVVLPAHKAFIARRWAAEAAAKVKAARAARSNAKGKAGAGGRERDPASTETAMPCSTAKTDDGEQAEGGPVSAEATMPSAGAASCSTARNGDAGPADLVEFTPAPGQRCEIVSVHHPVFAKEIGKRVIIVKVHPDTRQVWAHDDRPVTYKTNRAGRRVVDSDPSCIQSIYGFDQLRLIT